MDEALEEVAGVLRPQAAPVEFDHSSIPSCSKRSFRTFRLSHA